MNAVLVLLYKSFARYRRNKTAVALTFIVPIAMIYIFGEVFGLNRKQSGPSGIRLAVVDESRTPATMKLVDALRAEKAFHVITTFTLPDGSTRPLIASDVRPLIEQRAFRFAVVIPADSGVGLRLRILSDPQNEIETQTVNGVLQKTIFSRAPELLGQSLQSQARQRIGNGRIDTLNRELADAFARAFGGDPAEIRDAIAQGDFGLSRLDAANGSSGDRPANDVFSRLVNIETEQVVGANVQSPAATRVVGGWAIMFLMFALNGAATSLFDEKKSGVLQRLLAAPVTRAHILWSRFVFGIILGLVQLVTIFLLGNVLYGIDVTSHLGSLILVCIAAAAACTAFGMLIASVSSSPEAAQGLSTFLILTMSACGGAWFPVSFMPPFMQEMAKFTLTYWAMDGFTQVLWAGKSFVQVLPTVGILVAITVAVMAVAIWRFNRGRLFD